MNMLRQVERIKYDHVLASQEPSHSIVEVQNISISLCTLKHQWFKCPRSMRVQPDHFGLQMLVNSQNIKNWFQVEVDDFTHIELIVYTNS